MSVLVVDQFKAIEIEKENGQQLVVAFGTSDLAVRCLQEITRIEDIGDVIGIGALLGGVVFLGIAKCEIRVT